MLRGGGRGTAIAHGVTALGYRVTSRSFNVGGMRGDCRGSDYWVLPDRGRTNTYEGREKQNMIISSTVKGSTCITEKLEYIGEL